MKPVRTFFVFAAAIPLFFAACDTSLSGGGGYALIGSHVGNREQFWVQRADTGALVFDRINAVVLAEDSRCIVYAESNAAGTPKNGVTAAVAEQVSWEYWHNIHERITGAFGNISHVGPAGKVTLLLVDIQDGFSGGGFVAGYFNSRDMYNNASHSNKRDMLYIDTNPGLQYRRSLYATAAHELQHLINFCNTVFKGAQQPDLWINEGLSTAAEYLYGAGTSYGGDPVDRVGYYNVGLMTTIPFGNNFFVWNGPENDVLADYSTAYLFFQWLRVQSPNGSGIYRDIVNNLRYEPDARAVTRAARSRIPALGIQNGDTAGVCWEKTLKAWLLANVRQDGSGVYGYKNQIGAMTGGRETVLFPYGFTGITGSPVQLLPGEGVFSVINGSPYVPPGGGGSSIKYVGISDESIDDDASGGYTGAYLLTYNANFDNNGTDEKGFLANGAGASSRSSGRTFSFTPSAGAAASDISASPAARRSPPEIYPVDIEVMRERYRRERQTADAATGE